MRHFRNLAVSCFVSLLLTISANAQTISPLPQIEREYVMSVDSEATISAGGELTISTADAVCSLLASGRGFFISDTTDPRQMGVDPSFASTQQFVRPEGVDPCVWVTLVEKNTAKDVEILIQFDRIIDGVPRPAPIPLFVNGSLPTTMLGLEKNASPVLIGPRFATLMQIGSEANTLALTNFRGPIQAVQTAVALADLEAATLSKEAAQADLEASTLLLETEKRKAQAALDLLNTLRTLNNEPPITASELLAED